MNEEQVVELMASSTSANEWSANADTVKSVCGGYPGFWWRAIIQSGLGDRVATRWGGDAQIHIERSHGETTMSSPRLN